MMVNRAGLDDSYICSYMYTTTLDGSGGGYIIPAKAHEELQLYINIKYGACTVISTFCKIIMTIFIKFLITTTKRSNSKVIVNFVIHGQ